MGPNQPFHALPPYQSGKQEILTIQQMVDYHIAVMREHTPHGPYLLGGYCVGATLAVEMARQLIAQGEDVQHLLLLDPPHGKAPSLKWMWRFVDKAGGALKWDLLKKIHLYDRYGVSILRWLRSTTRGKFEAIGRRLGLQKEDGSDPIALGLEQGNDETNILQGLDFAVYFLSSCLHTVEPLAIPATVFYPEETSYSVAREKRAAQLFAPVTVEIVPGTHHTCISRYSSVLASKMSHALEVIRPAASASARSKA
jgi:hypothetical protein